MWKSLYWAQVFYLRSSPMISKSFSKVGIFDGASWSSCFLIWNESILSPFWRVAFKNVSFVASQIRKSISPFIRSNQDCSQVWSFDPEMTFKWPWNDRRWPLPKNRKIYDEYLYQMLLKSCPKSSFLLNLSYSPSAMARQSPVRPDLVCLVVWTELSWTGWLKRMEQIPVSIQVNNKRIRSFIF